MQYLPALLEGFLAINNEDDVVLDLGFGELAGQKKNIVRVVFHHEDLALLDRFHRRDPFGVVGAGGIGQELKNSVDLLDFARLFTIILIILAMVTAIDQLSAWLRRRLV